MAKKLSDQKELDDKLRQALRRHAGERRQGARDTCATVLAEANSITSWAAEAAAKLADQKAAAKRLSRTNKEEVAKAEKLLTVRNSRLLRRASLLVPRGTMLTHRHHASASPSHLLGLPPCSHAPRYCRLCRTLKPSIAARRRFHQLHANRRSSASRCPACSRYFAPPRSQTCASSI